MKASLRESDKLGMFKEQEHQSEQRRVVGAKMRQIGSLSGALEAMVRSLDFFNHIIRNHWRV